MTRPPLAIVGGGILGLAVAGSLHRRSPGLPLIVLEKESEVGRHQTGHNSGVVHSGVYYRPGSLKARLCVEGRGRMVEYLRKHSLPYEECGKIIVATAAAEIPRLQELRRRATENGVPAVTWMEPGELQRFEPAVTGLAALRVPGTGITDYRAVARSLREELESDGVEVRREVRVEGGEVREEGIVLQTTSGPLEAMHVVNCGGLYSDRIARSLGGNPSVAIVPFRGEYYLIRTGRTDLLRGLVYPVPDPELPFLGVHFTRTVTGGIEVGPNAVWAMAREGYTKTTVNPREVAWALTYPGFLRVARRELWTGAYEMLRSLDKATFLRDLQRLVPSLEERDLAPGGAGVRAQAVTSGGQLCDDFVIDEGPRSMHILNAPSPGATASLAIADYVVDRLAASAGRPLG